ncbi:hypothetical protein [Granulicella sp. L46]|uniref:hypothetical protein n=1 Tax=Granulicella sp. L46 TaxID=1641865 RepID=UPI00131ADFA8|nr:hypothetical protein [Granulicella sp. L46]
MKKLILALILVWMTDLSEAQTPLPAGSPQGHAQADSIFQSIENGDIQSVGDHYVVTRKDTHLPISMIFKSCQGVGVNRDLNQLWVLPIHAAGSQIEVNTNLWVLPEDPSSRENSWYIKLQSGDSVAASLDDVLKVRISGNKFELYKSEARPHSDTFNNRYSFHIKDGEVLENALAGFYWGTILPSVVEKTKAKNYPYSDGYVISTLNPKSYGGTYPDVDHEFQIKGRLAMGSALDLEIVRRMIALQFKVMNDDPEKLFRIPCAVQPSGLREYHVRRNSLDNHENAEMFLLTGNIEILDESWRYYGATKDAAWLGSNIGNLENAASLTIANTDQYGRVWSDVYYEDQVIKDGRETEAGAFAAYSFGLLANMEDILGRKDKAIYYSGYSKRIATALVQPLPLGFWDEKSQCFIDWVDRNGQAHDHIHLLSNELPVLFGYASDAQANAVRRLIDEKFVAFEKFPSFVAADIADYTKSEIGNGGPYDLSAAGRYWYWDAAFWESRDRNDVLLKQLKAVANEAAQSGYFMGERYDMDSVYYVDGKDWHGAEMYYEYPCVYTSVLISNYLGFTPFVDGDLSIHPYLQGYGNVQFGIPQYNVNYSYAETGFLLKNRSEKVRRFMVDLSALYVGTTEFKLLKNSGQTIVGAKSRIELSPQEEARWSPIPSRDQLQ